MENALEAGLGHLLETLARNEPLVNISCDENGFTQATLKDVPKYEVLMIQLLYLEADVEKDIVLAALETLRPTPCGDWHSDEAEKIMMLYRHCMKMCRRLLKHDEHSSLLAINRIRAIDLQTHGSFSGKESQKPLADDRAQLVPLDNAASGPGQSHEPLADDRAQLVPLDAAPSEALGASDFMEDANEGAGQSIVSVLTAAMPMMLHHLRRLTVVR